MKILNLLILFFVVVLFSSCDGIKLNVESGSGSGNYQPKSVISVKAYMPNPGYEFDRWEGDIKYVEDISSKETNVVLPELSKDETLEINIRAVYEVDPSAKEYNLVVEGGNGSGSYLTYSVVTISADTPPEGYQFDKWVGDVQYVYNPFLTPVKVVVQKEDINLKASYKIIVVPTPAPTPIATVVPTAQPTVYPTPTPGQTIKLMPIGDSITQGSARTGDVRCKLWYKLRNAGLSFDFVGSMYGYRDQVIDLDCDRNHEGHSGWRADQLLGIMGGSASRYKPDMAIIHLGTNDITAKQSNSSTINDISGIIDQLRRYNSKVVIFVGIIPNYRSTHIKLTPDLNTRLAKLASDKTTSSSPVIYVDQFPGFTPSDVPDGCHPNNAGAEKMAVKWANAIFTYLNNK